MRPQRKDRKQHRLLILKAVGAIDAYFTPISTLVEH